MINYIHIYVYIYLYIYIYIYINEEIKRGRLKPSRLSRYMYIYSHFFFSFPFNSIVCSPFFLIFYLHMRIYKSYVYYTTYVN